MKQLIITYLRNVTLALDRLLNVVFLHGIPEETVSVASAKARNNGKRWACILCKWFDYTIERDHCTKSLSDEPTPLHAGVRALIQLILVTLVIHYALRFFI